MRNSNKINPYGYVTDINNNKNPYGNTNEGYNIPPNTKNNNNTNPYKNNTNSYALPNNQG
jgi:hypothetical protein